MRRRVFTLLALLSAAVAAPAQTPAPAVAAGSMPEDVIPGLRTVLDAAVKQAPQLVAAEIQTALAGAQQLYEGLAPMLPNVNGTLQYAVNESAVSGNAGASNRNSGFFYNVGVTQQVFQWGALKYQNEAMEVTTRISERNYAEAYRLLMTTLRRQYLLLVVKKICLRNARASLQHSVDAAQRAEKEFADGMIAAGDLNQLHLSVDQGTHNANQIEQDYLFWRRTLAHLAGMNDLEEASIPMEIPQATYSETVASGLLQAFLSGGVKDTFQAQIQELSARQWDYRYDAARVRQLPKFYVGASVSLQNQTTASANSVNQTAITSESYGIFANWDIFDGLATRGYKAEALSWKRYYERQLQTVSDSLADQAQNSERTVALAAQQMAIAGRQWDLANAGLEETRKDLGLGYKSRAEYDNSLDNLHASDAVKASARADYFGDWSDFVSLVGADPALNTLPKPHVR